MQVSSVREIRAAPLLVAQCWNELADRLERRRA
jgi:hypothetical protein